MKQVIILLLLFSGINNAFGQKVEKIFLDKIDSSLNRFIAFVPNKNSINGFMFLIPSFGETPEEVLIETEIPKIAAQNGILTVIPVFQTGLLSAGVDQQTQQSFLKMIKYVVAEYKLKKINFYVGGFSIGGTCAVKFAELANQKQYNWIPKAVFAIDPPLDFERLYNSSKRLVRLSVDTPPGEEAVYLIQRIENEMGGNPQTALSNFHKISPYSFSDHTQSAIKSLIDTPIRIYTEPNIELMLNAGMDYYSMNSFDASAFINELKRLGNEKAFLITTQNKGYRKYNNSQHPHSWSIAEPNDLVRWLQEQ